MTGRCNSSRDMNDWAQEIWRQSSEPSKPNDMRFPKEYQNRKIASKETKPSDNGKKSSSCFKKIERRTINFSLERVPMLNELTDSQSIPTEIRRIRKQIHTTSIPLTASQRCLSHFLYVIHRWFFTRRVMLLLRMVKNLNWWINVPCTIL